MHPSSLKWFARCSLSSKRVVMMHTKVIATYCPIVYLSSDVTSYLNIREWDVFLVKNSRPLPSSKNPHFQNEAKCAAFLVKMNFICMKMKNQFHIKGWALNLVFIQRPRGNSEMAYSHYQLTYRLKERPTADRGSRAQLPARLTTCQGF